MSDKVSVTGTPGGTDHEGPISGEQVCVGAIADTPSIESSPVVGYPEHVRQSGGADMMLYKSLGLDAITGGICLLASESVMAGSEQAYQLVEMDRRPMLVETSRPAQSGQWDLCLGVMTTQSDTGIKTALQENVVLGIEYEPDGRIWTPVYTVASDTLGLEALGTREEVIS